VQLNDTYRHKGLRRQLIDELKAKGIKDEKVLDAMSSLPRHFFLDSAFEEWAYLDKAFPIGNEQTISQPYTVAYMTALLAVKQGENILEIGTGSGYQAAILALLGARVYTVERQEHLYKRTKKLLERLDLTDVRCFFKDGTHGLPEYAPYHKIIVTAGIPAVPEALRQQLAIGGILIIPVGKDAGQRMLKIVRHDTNEFETIENDTFRFVPFLKGVNKHK
jgi:protein-L-isoaspartate(D-aspartate) O-methyltransferase